MDNTFLNYTEIICEDTNEVCYGYKNYLKSKHWHNLRIKYISSESRCEKCKSTENLQLHHLNYKRLGKEKRSDFKILCDECHKKFHKKRNKKKKSRKPKCCDCIHYIKNSRSCELGNEIYGGTVCKNL